MPNHRKVTPLLVLLRLLGMVLATSALGTVERHKVNEMLESSKTSNLVAAMQAIPPLMEEVCPD